MRKDQVLDTYDGRYAAEYDDTFLHDGWTRESVAFQLALLGRHLSSCRNWLDVACGTGFILSRFPDVERAGLDISAAMLEKARQQNPGVTLVERDYRLPFPEWNDKWDLVSCMWWAYCFSETMTEIQQVIGRLADWTSPGGTCFMPLANVQKFDLQNIRVPYIDPRVPGRCMITGVTWSWVQENGKRHDDMLSPQVDHMVAMFRQHFETVDIVEGPLDSIGEGWRVQDVLVAKRKRAQRPVGDLFEGVDGQPPGTREWLFVTLGSCVANLSYPSRDLRHVRITISQPPTTDSAVIRAEKVGYQLEGRRRYRLTFSARSDADRHLTVGVAMGQEPWDNLGFSREVPTNPQWTLIEFEFESTATCPGARVYFDLSRGGIAAELRNVTLAALP